MTLVPSRGAANYEHLRTHSPASHMQEYLWERIERGDHSPAAMNMAFSINLRGTISPEVTQEVIEEIVNSVDIFRMNFIRVGRAVHQVMRPAISLNLKITDYQALSSEEAQRALLNSMRRLSARRFDLEKDILIRARLFKLPEGSQKLYFVVHHLIFDGYSRALFVEHFLTSYNAKIDPARPKPEPIKSYAAFASWERNLAPDLIASNEAFWKNRLDGLRPPRSFDKSMRPPRNDKCLARRFCINASLRDDIQKAARKQNCSLFLGLCSIFAGILTKWTATRDLAIWFPCIQRMETDHANTIGPIYINLPLRIHLAGDPTLPDIMRIIRTDVLAAIEHQWISATRLQKLSGTGQEIGFNFTTGGFANRGVRIIQDIGDFYFVEDDIARPERHPYDLVLALANKQEGMTGGFNYNTSRFSRNEIDGLISEFCALSRKWCQTPDTSLSEIAAEISAWPGGPSAITNVAN